MKAGVGRGRPQTTLQEKGEKRDHTPDAVVKVPIRGSSTPTGDLATEGVPDWDASQICSVNRTQMLNLDESIAAPVSALQFPTIQRENKSGSNRPSLNTTRGPMNPRTARKPQTAMKTKKTLGNKVFETEVKAGMTILEDPDAITDDDIDMVYAIYIQSEFIKHMSEKALARTKEEVDNKVGSAWNLLEESRQKLLELEEELQMVNLISDLQDTFEKVGPILGIEPGQQGEGLQEGNLGDKDDLLSRLRGTEQRLGDLSNGLEDVKHNIEVKGISIASSARAKTAETILSQLGGFNEKHSGPKLMQPEIKSNMQILDKFRHESESILSKSQECGGLLDSCRTLATKEASLRISLQEFDSVQPRPAASASEVIEAASEECIEAATIDLIDAAAKKCTEAASQGRTNLEDMDSRVPSSVDIIVQTPAAI